MNAPAVFPENFKSLHAHEEANREKSVAAVSGDELLALHFDALERSMNLLEYFARGWKTDDPDDIALQLLGIRLFNGAGAAIKLLLAGYHQAAASQAREVLETSFLVDLLANDKPLITAWRLASDQELKKRFRPLKVRLALDKRYGHTTMQRAAHYSLLSSLASHPTPQGFRLLRPGPNQPAFIGPFFNDESLKAVGSELAKVVIPAASNFRRHFQERAKGLADCEVVLHHLEGVGRWMEKFFHRPYDPAPARELASIIAELKRQVHTGRESLD